MKSQDLTQAELAGRLGVTQAAVSKWLNGSIPRGDQMLAIADALKVRMEWLLTGRGGQTIDETIAGAEGFFGEPMTGKQRETARKILEKRDLAYQPAKILRKLAETEDLLMAAQQKVQRLEEKLAAARKALE